MTQASAIMTHLQLASKRRSRKLSKRKCGYMCRTCKVHFPPSLIKFKGNRWKSGISSASRYPSAMNLALDAKFHNGKASNIRIAGLRTTCWCFSNCARIKSAKAACNKQSFNIMQHSCEMDLSWIWLGPHLFQWWCWGSRKRSQMYRHKCQRPRAWTKTIKNMYWIKKKSLIIVSCLLDVLVVHH